MRSTTVNARPRLFASLVALFLSYSFGLFPYFPARSVNALLSKPNKSAAQTNRVPAHRKGELLVRFRDGTSERDKDIAAATHAGRRKRQLRGESSIEKLELTGNDDAPTAALQLTLNPNVEFAEPNFLIAKDQVDSAPNDPRFAEQWAISNTGQNGGQYGSDIGVTSTWGKTTGTQATVIAIVDSGVDFTHPDLINNQWTNSTPSTGDDHGWDYITDTGNIKDEQGHGTAIAGIIAAQGNNGTGVTGVMWRASLMSLRVLDNTGSGDVANAVEAIDYAVAHGAQVINLSWGTTGDSRALKDAIKRAIKHNVAVVCSAGNGGQDLAVAPYYPASFGIKDLITVAGTDNFDRLTSWSNWGQDVTVAAPGTDVLTTQMGGGYWNVSGTSASAPLVAGIVGLLKSANPALEPDKVVKALNDGARQVASLTGKVASGGVVSGSGAVAKLGRLLDQPIPLPTPSYGNNGNGGQAGGPYVPPALRTDNDGRRAHGKDGKRVEAPATKSGAPLGNLPDLTQSRKNRKSPATSAPAPIHANMMCSDCDPGGGGGAGGSDPYFGTARTRPTNKTGTAGVTLGSQNFNWSVPLVSLPGRSGLDLSVSLFYNSLVWTRQGNAIQYNADHGTPAPGFQIGLPRLQTQYYNSDASVYAYTMITSSGGRIGLRQVGGSSVYESADSAYTQLTFSGSTPVVNTTDGTQYVFGTAVSGEWRCTAIEDRNGNYISATYTSNGQILTITDTLGRVLNFNYDGDGNLDNISQTWGGSTHAWVYFHYASVYMAFNFSALTPVGPTNYSYQTVLSYISFPENTSYFFDYNSYGQVYQIRHKAPDGHELEHTLYTIDTSSAQTDCPRFTDSRYYAQDWNSNAEAITYYSVTNNSSWTNPETSGYNTGTLVQQTAPDGMIYREYSHATGWDAGLPQLSEYWLAGAKKKWLSTTWTQDNTGVGYMLNPRTIEGNIYDDSGNRKRTTIEYNFGYGMPTNIREYSGSNGQTFQRYTVIAYKGEADYINRRIIGLPYEHLVYDGPTGNLMSREIYHYDWGDQYLSAQAPSTNYDVTNYPSSFIVGRGNLVAIRRYDCTNGTTAYDENQARWIQLNGYNMAGSRLWTEDGSWHHTAASYGDNFSDSNNNRNTLAYATTVTDPDGYSSTAQYNYDFGALTRTHVPTSGTGSGTTYLDVVNDYDAYGRPESATNQTNGVYKRFVYETNANYVHTYQTIVDLTQANEFHSWQVLDGAGRVRASASDHNSGTYSGQYVIYDNMGHVAQQSNPTEMNGSWTPTGDDSAWYATQQAYDWKGRPTQTTNTDGTTRVISYGGCGCAGGEVSTVQDEHGRQRRFTKDSLGRLATVEELNWDTSVYATTSYTYNARDQMTQSNQSGQVRSFAYDGHGRLQTRTTPEQGATNYSYNDDDTVSVLTDARGATTSVGYNGRHLVTSLTYGANGGATSTPNVYSNYDAAGNRTAMYDGQGSVMYTYNNLAQLTSETRSFSGLGYYELSYGYNLAGELNNITNPWGAQVGYDYDKAGRLTNVSGSGYSGVSNYSSGITYRAFGAIKGMNYGDTRALSTAYDARLRATTWNVSSVIGYNYNYDYFNEHTGRVTYAGSVYDSSLDRSYEYDNAGRLATSHTGAEARAAAWTGQWGTMDGPYSQGYDYDVWGNVTHKYGWGGEVQGGSAGQSSDHYYSYTGNRRDDFSYDAAGNLTNDLGQNFAYDATGQQSSASYGGYSLTQEYDGDGLRIKKAENGTVTDYLRSTVLGGQVIAEISGSGVWQRGYVYQGGNLLAVQQGGVYWTHEDPVTKSKRVTDSSGNVVSYVELDPWGADTNRSSNAAFQPHKYTTYEHDSNGSDEAMFRRYNRWHSRFDQPDPYDGSYVSTNPQSFNRYAYTANDPVNLVDPNGLMWVICQWDYSDGRIVGGDCFGGDGWGGFGPTGGGLGGGTRGKAPQPAPMEADKPKCKQSPDGGDVAEILDYLSTYGLMDLIDTSTIKHSTNLKTGGVGEGIQFQVYNRADTVAALTNDPHFINARLGFEHNGQVGGKATDFRGITGDDGDKGSGAAKSLQFDIGPSGGVPGDPNRALGYADLDCDNPAQSPGHFLKHIFK